MGNVLQGHLKARGGWDGNCYSLVWNLHSLGQWCPLLILPRLTGSVSFSGFKLFKMIIQVSQGVCNWCLGTSNKLWADYKFQSSGLFLLSSNPPHPRPEHFCWDLSCSYLHAHLTLNIVVPGLPSGDNSICWWHFRHIHWQNIYFYTFSYQRDLTSVSLHHFRFCMLPHGYCR